MKKVLSILATTAMAFSFLGANVAQACDSGCRCGCHREHKQHEASQCKCGCNLSKEDFAKVLAEKEAALNAELGLSKAQQEKAKVIFAAKRSALLPVITELKAKKQALAEVENSSFQITKIKAKRAQKKALKNEISALKEKRKAIFEKFSADFEATLTEAQKVKWNEIKAKHSAEHGKRHHKHLRGHFAEPHGCSFDAHGACPCGCHKK